VSSARCIFCGRRPIDWHHLTGRAVAEGEYLDPELVVPFCRRHHSREHVLLADKGLEWLPDGDDSLVHRLRRVRLFFERCADFGRVPVLDPASERALGLLLGEDIAALLAARIGKVAA
jgi:hypothetical protein